MNQRLIELYRSCRSKEALASQDQYNSANVLLGTEVEKFAELIVRECIGCCDEVDRINQAYIEEYCVDPENGPKECIQVIKAHFGVEE